MTAIDNQRRLIGDPRHRNQQGLARCKLWLAGTHDDDAIGGGNALRDMRIESIDVREQR